MSREEELIAIARAGDPAWAKCSTSERITVALATGWLDELPREFDATYLAWLRLNARQREIVRRHNPWEAAWGDKCIRRQCKALGVKRLLNDHS